MNRLLIATFCVLSSLPIIGQTTFSSVQLEGDTIFIDRELEEVTVVQDKSSQMVNIADNKLRIDVQNLQNMPKFLGTSDPIRYLQSLAGIQTNNETSTGIHIQGCDDYQTLTAINGAPIYYPNHLLGLFSTFIAPHFEAIEVEQSEHNGLMENRIGGYVNLLTRSSMPKRFSMEGNVGLVNSDVTMAIPCGDKGALFVSGRGCYIDLLYKKWLRIGDWLFDYWFADGNVTYVMRPSEYDELGISGFYSYDHLGVTSDAMDISLNWQNAMGQMYWKRHLEKGTWQTSLSTSYYGNAGKVRLPIGDGTLRSDWNSIDLKNRFQYTLRKDMALSCSMDYTHYINRPVLLADSGIMSIAQQHIPILQGQEVSAGINFRHQATQWFDYTVGLHGSAFHSNQWFWGCDPRLSFTFVPHPSHELTIYAGLYTQYFHKICLTQGGLPTDFFTLADSTLVPERAVGTGIRYTTHLFEKKYTLQAEAYFKQIYHIVESQGNILALVNNGFDYNSLLVRADGRNAGMNLMFQKNRGVITGYISYSYGRALRKIPALDGSEKYIYSASYEREHDLNIVLNANFAKRWHVSAQFVLASGIPYTPVEEVYMLNNTLIWVYGKYNSKHIPIYHRLDLSCSYDIIKRNGRNLGINLSIYNVYCRKNAQFMVYRKDFTTAYGSALSTIIPSISIYGTL